ncbi:MAG: hypothetical protein LBC61_01700 [Candidatus Peribacteria bacterium]|nr:hypothetical protein [Candidatus Peribacteria bacterium]
MLLFFKYKYMVYSVGIPPSKGDEVGKLIIALDGKTPKEAKEFISSLPQEDRDYFTFKFNDLLGMV